MNGDRLCAMGLLGLGLVVSFAYLIRILLKGQAHFERVDQQGSSVFLGKCIMELGYWFFQPLARFLVLMHVTPNQISWASLVSGFFAGVALSVGHFGFGAVLAAFSGIFDSLDGLVARLTQQGSGAGEILDATVDRYSEFFFLGGLAFYYRLVPGLLLLCLVALMGAFMVSYSTAKAEALRIRLPKGMMRRPERAVYLTLGAALSPLTSPWWETDQAYPVAIGYPMAFAIALVAVAAHFSAIDRLRRVAKSVRLKEVRRQVFTAQSLESEDPMGLNASSSS